MGFKELRPENDAEWLSMRANVLTATDMGVILGLNKWKSVSELIASKESYEPFENSYTWLGQTLEPVVVESTNKVLGSDFKLFENGSRSFFIDPDIGLGATPDAGNAKTLLECKSTKPGNYLRWAGWPPAYYLSQLYTQMICTGRQEGLLAIMSTNMTQTSEVLNIPIHIHKLTRTKEIDDIFFFEVNRFWEARKINKLYRVNRKQATTLEMTIRFNTEIIYDGQE